MRVANVPLVNEVVVIEIGFLTVNDFIASFSTLAIFKARGSRSR